jgi:hypothetical protein
VRQLPLQSVLQPSRFPSLLVHTGHDSLSACRRSSGFIRNFRIPGMQKLTQFPNSLQLELIILLGHDSLSACRRSGTISDSSADTTPRQHVDVHVG